MAINFPEGVQDAPFDANFVGDHGPTTSISNQNTWSDIGLETADITVKDSNSKIVYYGFLGTEVDGTSTGHGVARVQYSFNSGTSYTVHNYYNMTGSNDNSIGNGFMGYWSHGQSAGTTIRFRVQYLKNGTTGNHTVADTGPGYSQVTRFVAFEVNT